MITSVQTNMSVIMIHDFCLLVVKPVVSISRNLHEHQG